jgi:tetratricopeptide (TPR) repeat protein
MIPISPAESSAFRAQLRAELLVGDWEALYKTATEWLAAEPNEPVATFIQNIACLFINPPEISRNKSYLNRVTDEDWKAVTSWMDGFTSQAERHNAYFQALNFITIPETKPKKKTEIIEAALKEHPDNAELLFFEAILLPDRNLSIQKLKQAMETKPEFPAALYLIGIFSLLLGQVEEAENYLKQAVKQAPDFIEANYQLGSLYFLYIPDADDLAKRYFEKVVALDPVGDSGSDAIKVLETNSIPKYGQQVANPRRRRGGLSILTITGLALMAVWLFAYPISSIFNIKNPAVVGVMAGVIVFIGLYTANYRRR